MTTRNQHQNAAHANQFGSSNNNQATVFSFCDAPNSWDAPVAELDMFTRWIKLSDEALAASCKVRKAVTRRRDNVGASCRKMRMDLKFPIAIAGRSKSAGPGKAVQIS